MFMKLTYTFIKEQFEKESYILLTKEYKNSDQKLDYICPNKHRHSISWNKWQQGRRCPYCVRLGKPIIEEIEKLFKKENYTLLTKKYINCVQKLYYICSNDHRSSITWSDWRVGKRCLHCAGLVKLNLEFIRSEFKKENYILLTKKYKNAFQKLDYICPKEHKHSINWNKWQQGKRCPTCAIVNNSGPGNPNWKGGISKEPYCQDWTKDLKNYVKERDGHKCMNPYCFKRSNKLVVHHIDYNKKSCGPENLITVCSSCNSMANKDRDWHQEWYQTILNKRYGYV